MYAALRHQLIILRRKLRKVSKTEAMLHTLVAQALRGDAKAFALLIAQLREQGQFAPDPTDHCIEVVFVKPDGTRSSSL